MSNYKERAALMQGLIDRSEVFLPLPCKINIFNLEESKDYVNFVYDDEATLPSGRKSFEDWKNEINSSIGHGSRILLTGEYREMQYSTNYDKVKRLFYYCREFNVPNMPTAGIYDVEEYKVEEEKWLIEPEYQRLLAAGNIISVIGTRQDTRCKPRNHDPEDLYAEIRELNREKTINDFYKEYRCKYKHPYLRILYNPNDTVYGGWGRYEPHDRKKRIGWKIYSDDKFVLNYDRISMEDIDFYLTSRVDRPNYLDMMPVLVKLKEMMLAEQAKEAPFIQMLVGSIGQKSEGLSIEEIQARVIKCVDWWKHKNMIKRPIDKDDILAIRMIEKRVLSKNYSKLDWDY